MAFREGQCGDRGGRGGVGEQETRRRKETREEINMSSRFFLFPFVFVCVLGWSGWVGVCQYVFWPRSEEDAESAGEELELGSSRREGGGEEGKAR